MLIYTYHFRVLLILLTKYIKFSKPFELGATINFSCTQGIACRRKCIRGERFSKKRRFQRPMKNIPPWGNFNLYVEYRYGWV